MYYWSKRWYNGCLSSIGMLFIGIFLNILYSFVLSLIGVWLWNYAMVSMFSIPEITFWKMFSLMVLVRLFIPIKINYNKNSERRRD